MPERWETQIRSCARLEPPEGLRERVSEGPRGEPPSPPRRRVAAAVTAFVVFAAAAVLVVRAPPDRGPRRDRRRRRRRDPHARAPRERRSARGDPPVRRPDTGRRPRGLQVVSDGGCVAGIADFTIYPPVGSTSSSRPARRSARAVPAHSRSPRDRPRRRADLRRRSVLSPTPTAYALEAEATWPDGEANFFFGVQVLSNRRRRPTSCASARTDDRRSKRPWSARSRTDSTSRSAARRATRASRS